MTARHLDRPAAAGGGILSGAVPPMPLLSIVLPAFNEVDNLDLAVSQVRIALADVGPCEVVIVDDGSTDGTGDLAERLADGERVRLVRHPENRGKGAALRSGVAAARAPVVGFTDADLPFDMEALARAYRHLTDTGADMVAGFRTNRERYSLRRRVYSGTYNRMVRALLGVPLDDVGFALKLMRREVFEAADLQSDGGFADVELIARAYRMGARIERVGVAFTPRVHGTSTMAGPASVAGIVRDMVLFRLGRLGTPPGRARPRRMTPPAARLRPPVWLVACLAVACYWRIGYGYGLGDHEELLPQLLRALDPSLFPRDPYLLAEDDAFSVRFVWLGVLRLTCLFVPPPVAVFVWSVVAWAGVSWAAWRVAALVVPDRLAATLAVLATLATVQWMPGGNALVTRTLTPEALAWIPALLAVEAFARGRPYRSAVLLGLGGWIQPLMGLQVGLMLGLVALWRTADGEPRRAFVQAVGFGALFFAVASPILVPTLATQAGTAPSDDGLTTFYVTAWLRQAHHYLLFSQAPTTFVKTALVVAAGLAGLAVLRQRGGLRHTRFAGRALAVIAGLCVFYVAMTEGAENLTVAKMQFFRLLVLAKLILLAWAAGAAVSFVPARWRRWPDARGGWALAAGAVAVTVAMGVGGVGRPASVWRPAEHRKTDLYRAERWIAENTPHDAVFLVPPGTTSFRSHALRSVAVNFKPTTFRDDAMHRWLARIREVAPAPLPDRADGRAALYRWRSSLDSAYHAHTPAEWAALAESFDADFALIDTTLAPTPPAGRPVFRAGPWAVVPLR